MTRHGCALAVGLSLPAGTAFVYDEYVFGEAHRRRKNPCHGQNPTEVDD